MRVFFSFLTIVLGFLLSGVWFGTTQLLSGTRFGKLEYTHYVMPIISSLLPLVCILPFCEDCWGDLRALTDGNMWCITLATAILVPVFIRIFIHRPYQKRGSIHYLLTLFEAGSMEIPMRLLMMNFILLLLRIWNLPSNLAVAFTGVVWCAAILVQALVFHEDGRETLVEMAASFLFSLGIGYVYNSTRVLIFPVVGHILERFLGLEGDRWLQRIKIR